MGIQVKVEHDPVVSPAEYPLMVTRYQANIERTYQNVKHIKVRVVARVLVDGPFKDVEVTHEFNQRITPRTDMYNFLVTLDIPVPDQIGAQVDLDAMVGKVFVGKVEPNQTEKGTYNNFVAWRRYIAGQPVYVAPPVATAPVYVTVPQPVGTAPQYAPPQGVQAVPSQPVYAPPTQPPVQVQTAPPPVAPAYTPPPPTITNKPNF